MGGQIVDATLVPRAQAAQHRGREGRDQKPASQPADLAVDKTNKAHQKDVDARWT